VRKAWEKRKEKKRKKRERQPEKVDPKMAADGKEKEMDSQSVTFHAIEGADDNESPSSAAIVVIFIPDGVTLYLKGVLGVRVAEGGTVEVMGATLEPGMAEEVVYSPRGFSLLGMRAKAKAKKRSTKKGRKVEEDEVLSRSPSLTKMANEKLDQNCVVVVAKTVSNDWTDYLNRHLPLMGAGGKMSLFGRDSTWNVTSSESVSTAERLLNVTFCGAGPDLSAHPARVFQENPEWESSVSSAGLAAGRKGKRRKLQFFFN
jgi:hypothetical protein